MKTVTCSDFVSSGQICCRLNAVATTCCCFAMIMACPPTIFWCLPVPVSVGSLLTLLLWESIHCKMTLFALQKVRVEDRSLSCLSFDDTAWGISAVLCMGCFCPEGLGFCLEVGGVHSSEGSLVFTSS